MKTDGVVTVRRRRSRAEGEGLVSEFERAGAQGVLRGAWAERAYAGCVTQAHGTVCLLMRASAELRFQIGTGCSAACEISDSLEKRHDSMRRTGFSLGTDGF
jgi:hypothetical protein